MYFRLFSLLVLVFTIGFNSHAQDIYDYQNSRKYANYLLRTNQYDLATSEYERILFFRPQNDTIKQVLLKSYRLSGNTNGGLQRMATLYVKPELAFSGSAIEYTRLLLDNQLYDNAKQYLQLNQTLAARDKKILSIQTELFSKNYQAASALLSDMQDDQSILIREYNIITQEGLNFKRKSPGLALMFSAVIPGSGKVYARDWKDGLFSFIMIGGLAWQAYRGFNKDGVESAYGWVFGGIGFGFYVGNLYGSFKSAQRYNHVHEHDLERRIEANFNNNY